MARSIHPAYTLTDVRAELREMVGGRHRTLEQLTAALARAIASGQRVTSKA